MKISYALWAAALLVFFNIPAPAATLYVDLNSTNPVPPYADWSNAATNIQDAVDASTNGDLILVTNGIYQTGGRVIYGSLTNRIAIDKAVTVQSVNGPVATVIQGYPAGSNPVRCAYLTNNAMLVGFTLFDGGVQGFNGFNLNVSTGGGVWCESKTAIVSDCILTTNTSPLNGGGAYSGTLNGCWLIGNSATNVGGGASSSALNNCLLTGNTAGSGAGADGTTLNNCTVVGNSAKTSGGAVSHGTVTNSIVYYNTPGNGSDSSFSYCCQAPPLLGGLGNVTNAPLFLNLAGNDFHLQSNSPCINSGNNAYATTATDLDGNPRIVGGTVDIGVYEYQSPVSKISYAWIQQYGLPVTTNIDTSDLDGTGFTVYQDWIAGLNPTNALSVLAMLPPVPTNNPAGLVVSWESVSNRTYFLQSSTNLAAQPAFSTMQSNIVGQPNTTSFMDTNAVGNGPFFYRVGVQ